MTTLGKAEAKTPDVVSEVAQAGRPGLDPVPALLGAGGLVRLVMPCVWPMVPITVNFFVKQGQHDGPDDRAGDHLLPGDHRGVHLDRRALLVLLLGHGVQNLANNAWLNTFVAFLFLAFGLSLLGVFEIRLPNFLLNASAQGRAGAGSSASCSWP